MGMFGKGVLIGIIVFVLLFSFGMTYAVIDGNHQKEKLDNMNCNELKDYIIDKAISPGGFPAIAKDLFKYKCELSNIVGGL